MANLNPSALSIAAAAISDLIDTKFRRNGVKVHLAVDSPAGAKERVKDIDKAHLVNLFFYRISTSGFHAAQGPNDPLFLRFNCLITPFADLSVVSMDRDEADLRILGEIVRIFHETPVLDAILAGRTPYRMQAVLLTPDMEELNHIWTTQGADVPYKLSAAYEFSLVPLDPLLERPPATPVGFGIADVEPNIDLPISDGVGQSKDISGNTVWMPFASLIDSGAPSNIISVPASTATVPFALAGPVNSEALIEITRVDEFGRRVAASSKRRNVATEDLSSGSAIFNLDISGNGGDGAKAVWITARAASPSTAPFGPRLTVTLEGS